MKIGFIIGALCLSLACYAQPDLSHSKVYRSLSADVDATITVVPTEDDKQFLLLFKGFESAIDGTAKLYQKTPESSNPADGYHFQLFGTNQVHLRSQGKETLISGSMVPYVEVYLEGRAPIKMIFAYKADIVEARKVQDQYRRYQNIVTSGVEAKRALRQAHSDMLSSCAGSAELEFDGAGFSQKSIPGMGVTALHALQKVCEQDDDYRVAAKNLKQIRLLASSEKNGFEVQAMDGVLSISFEAQSANLYDRALEALKNKL